MAKKTVRNDNKNFISTMRAIAIDGINKAKQGHIGMALGASEIFYSLVAKKMHFSSLNPKWIDRDRFVLSAGHGSMGLYSLYHLLGLLSIEDIKNHKEFNSKTPSHPEIDKLDYVDASTGPLGQGVAMAVGMAWSAHHLAEKFNQFDFKILNHSVFALCGDGDLQEGVALEAIQFAGTNKLNKLILIHDFNNVQIDSKASEVNNIDFANFFKSNNFNVIILKSNDPEEIEKAITRAKRNMRPTYIQVPTTIAFATPMANLSKGHNGILNETETIEFKKKLSLSTLIPFEYDSKAYELGNKMMHTKNASYKKWEAKFLIYKEKFPILAAELEKIINHQNEKFTFSDLKFKQSNVATRNYVGEIVDYLDKNYYTIIGGSADLRAATKVGFNDNKNIKYGIREFAMIAINNGIYLHSGLKTLASTFLVFSDYAKSALRLGALMEIPGVSIFTHDSYQVGGDGPTHQPVEQLTMLRSIPNYLVFRPADENEMLNSFKYALNLQKTPSAIIACRQEIKSFNKQGNEFKAGYFIKEEKEFDLTLLASGSEVELAYNVANELMKENIKANVVSVPSLQLLLEDEVLIKELKLDKKPLFAI
ncbi:transketolase [Mesomycoplasma molare]|nr:transketolase [Mesomycoplasma molare]